MGRTELSGDFDLSFLVLAKGKVHDLQKEEARRPHCVEAGEGPTGSGKPSKVGGNLSQTLMPTAGVKSDYCWGRGWHFLQLFIFILIFKKNASMQLLFIYYTHYVPYNMLGTAHYMSPHRVYS